MRETHTPRHTVRINDDLWAAALQAAARRGETVSDVVRRALHDYVKETK